MNVVSYSQMDMGWPFISKEDTQKTEVEIVAKPPFAKNRNNFKNCREKFLTTLKHITGQDKLIMQMENNKAKSLFQARCEQQRKRNYKRPHQITVSWKLPI